MTERHHYKYVVLDSSKENGNAVQARFNVQIPHGITNASRVCVKSFSMPNVIHSVYGDLKTVRFVEFYRPTPPLYLGGPSPPQKYILLTFCDQDDGSSRFLELVT